jgi:hypothetical protein
MSRNPGGEPSQEATVYFDDMPEPGEGVMRLYWLRGLAAFALIWTIHGVMLSISVLFNRPVTIHRDDAAVMMFLSLVEFVVFLLAPGRA